MKLQRLLTLIEFMENLKLKKGPKAPRFNMLNWYTHKAKYSRHLHTAEGMPLTSQSMGCGTSACALGWGGTIPALRREGLRVIAEKGGLHNLNAARDFFELSDVHTRQLFGFGSAGTAMREIKTPRRWAQEARKLLEGWTSHIA